MKIKFKNNKDKVLRNNILPLRKLFDNKDVELVLKCKFYMSNIPLKENSVVDDS